MVSTRPSRRAAARKIIEDSDEENSLMTTQSNDEDDFKSKARTSPRKNQGARAGVVAATDRRDSTLGFTHTALDATAAENQHSPILGGKTASLMPSTRRSRLSAVSNTADPQALAQTGLESLPRSTKTQSLPLSDITTSVINEQALPRSAKAVSLSKPLDAVLEKPMDIVIRTRALGLPQASVPGPPKQRTVIKNLVLTNFKSYAGRQIVGPFHASFSSVVGPNGSGKSNVIDSLLFVFGFRASKMRQGKISALIHNSASHPDLDFCEVEVHFEEVEDLSHGGTVVKPDSNLTISRKAFKNNSSDYFIDGKRSTFTTVTTLLRDRGVDLDHKRFLILQGEVESIAQMKPKALTEHDDGLLEYLEDIIGTSRYKGSIEESATEVETLNETCIEKNERFQHIEREKNSLEDKKDKALRQVRLENDLASKQWGLYQVYDAECQSNISVSEEALNKAKSELDQELVRHSGSENEVRLLEENLNKQLKEFEKLSKEFETKTQEYAKIEKEQVKLDEKRKFIALKRKRQEKTLQTSKTAISETVNQIRKHDDDLKRFKGETNDLEKQLQMENGILEQIRESLKGKTQVFSDEITLRQKDLEPWLEKVNSKKSEITVTSSELDMLLEHASAGVLAIEDAKKKIALIMQDGQDKVDRRSTLKREKTEKEASYQALKGELSDLHEREPKLRGRVSQLRQRADDAKSSANQTKSHGDVLAGLMRLKDTGRIDGFHGRLGNLGTIDQCYDVAISTACPALENLVVDSVESGQQCIDYLRKNNLGRANIICLDRLPKRDLGPINTPENAPRLFDLVKCKEPRYAPAFYSVLQNTLLAQDLEHANRIAYGSKRWRVVTLDGQVIDVSGTMSGGGTKVARGAMSAKLVSDISDQQLSEFETNCQSAEAEHNAMLSKIRSLEMEIKELSKTAPKLDMNLQMINLEVETMERSLQDAQKHLKDLENAQKAQKQDDYSIEKLQSHLSKLNEDLLSLHGQTTGIEAEISRLQDKIMEIGGLGLRAQKCKVDMLKEQIETLHQQGTNAEVAASRATKEQNKYEKTTNQVIADLAITAKEEDALEMEMSKHKDLTMQKQRLRQIVEDSFNEKRDELEDLRKKTETRTAEVAAAKGIEIELHNRVEENQKLLNENRKRSTYWQEKLGQLTLHSLADLNFEGGSNEITTFPSFSKDELLDMNKDVLKAEIAALEEQVQKHNVDLLVLEEYRRRTDEHNARLSELQIAINGRDLAKKRCDELRRLRLEGFMEGFGIISMRLKEMYQMITMGGNAELELVDSLDPFSEGILFSVMPPKKSWKNISNLSGGEKTLSSLALVFALHHYKPTPLYVMDEIDAALDFKNVSIVANYIKERTKNAQFIVISLRNNMFELAARLVGIYKVNQMTRSVTVENKDYIIRRTGNAQLQTQA